MPMIRTIGAAFNLRHLSMNLPLKKLKMSCNDCYKLFKTHHRDLAAQKIFKECFKLVIEDIIDNNITFKLPTGGRLADIHMLKYQDEDFIKLRKAGKWLDVDFLKSNFTGYQLGLFMYPKNRTPRSKNMYVCKRLKDKITKYTNEGKNYC